MLQLRDIQMGEISQLKPESGVIFKKSLSIGLQKSGFEKKISVSVSKYLVLKKGLSHSHFSLVTLNIDMEG